MDAFSALRIATSVAQFVEFGWSLVSETRKIYKSLNGATVSQVETSLAATCLLELSERMKSSLRDQTLPKPPIFHPSSRIHLLHHLKSLIAITSGIWSRRSPINKWEEYIARKDRWEDYTPKKAEFERQSEIYSKAKISQESLCEICDQCILLSNE